MFDNIPSNPPALGKEPEDIFAKVDSKPASAPTVPPSVSQPAPAVPSAPFPWRKSLLVIAIIAAVAILAGIAVLVYDSYQTPSVAPQPVPKAPVEKSAVVPFPPVEQQVQQAITNFDELPKDANQLLPEQVKQLKAQDTDFDQLLDYDELYQYKTDPRNPDTDGDGLSDSEEVKVYQTDPLRQDTDNDSYPDGAEVKNGYNPRGEGKLLLVPGQGQ
ncbi:MAG: hypothetical protein V1707_01690 [bacterium]